MVFKNECFQFKNNVLGHFSLCIYINKLFDFKMVSVTPRFQFKLNFIQRDYNNFEPIAKTLLSLQTQTVKC